jgi:hypothetical protein
MVLRLAGGFFSKSRGDRAVICDEVCYFFQAVLGGEVTESRREKGSRLSWQL